MLGGNGGHNSAQCREEEFSAGELLDEGEVGKAIPICVSQRCGECRRAEGIARWLPGCA